MGVTAPPQIQEAFATSGTANTIPVASQIGITPGAASFTDGFPPLTATPLGSGGVPPSVGDMNGILKMISAHTAYVASGAGYQYSSALSTAIGGYNIGAVLQSADNSGYWLNQTANNTTNPDTGGAGWIPVDQYGLGTVTGLAGANVTLNATQYGKQIIVLSGTLTAAINLIFPALAVQWIIVNNTTGAFAITCKTASGTGVVVAQGGWPTATTITGDGTNIYSQAGSFVTNASLAATLASYVTSASLAATLSSYVTQSSLSSQLVPYDTIAARNAALANYLTSAQVSAGYISNAELTASLAAYLTTANAASTYVSNALLSTTLSSYITATALNSSLANYQLLSGVRKGITAAIASAPGTTVTFSPAFTTACDSVVACAYGQNATVSVLTSSRTGFSMINGANGLNSWIAYGH